VDRADPTGGGALELARSAAPAPARRRTALAAVARPPPRWLGCCWWRSCAARGRGRPHSAWHDRCASAGRSAPACLAAGVKVTTRRVRVVKDADTSVLVHRVESAPVVRTREWPALGPQTMSNPRSARDNSATRTPSLTALPTRSPHVRRPPGKLSSGNGQHLARRLLYAPGRGAGQSDLPDVRRPGRST
jgi:hypothetical protein